MKCDNFWICDTLNPVLLKKIQNDGCIQDGVVHAIFSKRIICQFFFFYYLLWVEIRLLWKKKFLENLKWPKNLI
jgi:hypothetical protein